MISDEDFFLGNHLESLEIDLFIIASPCPSHFYYLDKLIDKQVKYILCEKPISSSIQEIDILLKRIHSNSCVSRIAINHQMRFMPHYKKIKEMQLQNDMGELCSISVQAGNMGFAMNVTHYIELLRFLSNSCPKAVFGWLSPQKSINVRGAEYEDYCGQMKIDTHNDVSMFINASEKQGHGIFCIFTFEKGQVFIDELSGHMFYSKRRNQADFSKPSFLYALESESVSSVEEPLNVMTSTQDVLISLLRNAEYPTLEQTSYTIKTLIAGIYSSSENSRRVCVDDLPDNIKEIKFRWA